MSLSNVDFYFIITFFWYCDASSYAIFIFAKSLSYALVENFIERTVSVSLAKIIFANLFYYLVYFYYYLYVSLYILVLFMSLTILFQLAFSFIYGTFNKKFSV